MKVVEIFDSMQGEGEWMGVYCTFVRFAGCNLQCPFCDEHEKYGKAKNIPIEKIVKRCKQQIVVLTGGEPTIQPDLYKLIDALHDAGHRVHIETNGTNEINTFVEWTTCSPKAPDYKRNCLCNEIKLVVSQDLTLRTALEISSGFRVWLQPCDGPWIEHSKKRIAEWIRKCPSIFRAGIQLHKYYNAR